jgi:hypothetical protein
MLSMVTRGFNKLLSRVDTLARTEMKKRERAILREIVTLTHEGANERLSGPGRTKVRLKNKKDFKYQDGNVKRSVKRKTARRGQSDALAARPGAYPVPVLSGHLRRMLGMVMPGHTVASNGLSFSAGSDEGIVFNSAEYASVIHDGTRSSKRFGPRAYITDSFEAVDVDAVAARNMENLF